MENQDFSKLLVITKQWIVTTELPVSSRRSPNLKANKISYRTFL
ncbi:hypothetical protein P4255_28135 [Bacillus wiedmannii]|nr:hypothetical protein [Bacillus wiedmannii]